MKEIEKSRTTEIKDLHGKFIESFKKTLDCGIRIGDLLKQQKDDLKHGEFGKWIEENLPFSIRTAQNYMNLHKERDKLKNATVSHLTEGYRLLTEPKSKEEGLLIDLPEHELRDMIREINALINDKRYEVREFTKWFFQCEDDGSMTEDEKIRYGLAFDIMTHICYYRQYIWHYGTDSLPVGLVAFIGKDIDSEPKGCCGKKKCPQDWQKPTS